MEFPPKQTFPTLIDPHDTFADLVVAARVHPQPEYLTGLALTAELVPMDPVSEPRMVEVRLLQCAGPYDLDRRHVDDLFVKDRLDAWGFRPLTNHEFLAFLSQYPDVCKSHSGVHAIDVRELEGYVCVLSCIDREGFKRTLRFSSVRSLDDRYRVSWEWTHLFAATPIRDDAKAPTFNNDF